MRDFVKVLLIVVAEMMATRYSSDGDLANTNCENGGDNDRRIG